MDQSEPMTYQDAAAYLGISYGALRAAVSRGDIPAFRPFRSKLKMLRRADVERYKRGERPDTHAATPTTDEQRLALAQKAISNAQNVWTEQDRAMVATIGSAFAPLALALRDALSNFFKAKESQGGSRLDDFFAAMIANPRGIGEEMARGLAAHESGSTPEQSEQYTREMGEFAERTVTGMLQMALQPSTAREREKVPA